MSQKDLKTSKADCFEEDRGRFQFLKYKLGLPNVATLLRYLIEKEEQSLGLVNPFAKQTNTDA